MKRDPSVLLMWAWYLLWTVLILCLLASIVAQTVKEIISL